MSSAAQPVLVAYDASADADRGLDWAADYARLRGLPLTVFASSGDLEYLPEWTVEKRDDIVRGWLDRAAERLRARGIEEFTTKIGEGRVVPDLLEAAQEASLLVLGAQGHGVVGGMVIGSVSQHVTRHAPCPVVVVRGAYSPEAKRIVVGVDGSELSMKALEFAFDQASWTGSELVAVHGRSVTAINGPFDVNLASMVGDEIDAAERTLSESVAGLREKYPDVQVDLQAVPLPGLRAIADASVNASLVVVGSRGRGGFLGLLLGSVSSSVLQHAKCSVAVVR